MQNKKNGTKRLSVNKDSIEITWHSYNEANELLRNSFIYLKRIDASSSEYSLRNFEYLQNNLEKLHVLLFHLAAPLIDKALF